MPSYSQYSISISHMMFSTQSIERQVNQKHKQMFLKKGFQPIIKNFMSN